VLASRSLRAERDAPFGPVCDGGALLQVDAAAEAERLALARTLASPRHPDLDAPGRPVLTLLSLPRRRPGWAKAGRRELILALRLLFIDPTGAITWDTIKGLAFGDIGPGSRHPVDIRRWFDCSIGERVAPLAAAASIAHEAALASLRRDVRASILPLLVRERAILERLNGGNARLAAPLLQPGLFDRRAVRDADAQRRVAAEAAARAEDRIRALERHCDLRAGERSLVFAITWSR
jgi:hypothetical protein